MANHGEIVSSFTTTTHPAQQHQPVPLSKISIADISRMIFLLPSSSSSYFCTVVEIVAHNVGFRPSRQGGCRLDLESIELGNGKREGMQLAPKSAIDKPRVGAVLHAYGIGELSFHPSLISHQGRR